MCLKPSNTTVSTTPNVPLEEQVVQEAERIEMEVDEIAAEVKHDCRVYTEIWSDIRRSKTAGQRARWRETHRFLRREIRRNLELLELYAEEYELDFPERHRHLLQINPPPAEGGANWIVETKDSFMIRGYYSPCESP